MDVALQEHGAKHVYRVPEGLRELCSDISREPIDVYGFIADYAEALLTTRQNARVAARVVNNILMGSEAIVAILRGTGLSFGQIAVAAPRLQRAFRIYLDSMEVPPVQISEDRSLDDRSQSSICTILESIGACSEKAEKAAAVIQVAFRGHYEKMLEREATGLVEWKRAAKSTTDILKRAGVSQAEAEEAVTLIQATYRGYYTRRNTKMKLDDDEEKANWSSLAGDLPESKKSIQAVAWLEMMYEDTDLDAQRANDAATLIQQRFQADPPCPLTLASPLNKRSAFAFISRSYRDYKSRKRSRESRVATSSANSLAVDEIAENAGHGVIENVPRSRDNIPRELKDDTELEGVAVEMETTYKKRFSEKRLFSKTDNDGIYEDFAENYEAIESPEKLDFIKDDKLYLDGESVDNSMEDTMARSEHDHWEHGDE